MDMPDLPPVEDGFLEGPEGWPLIGARVAALIRQVGGLTALALLPFLSREARRGLADALTILERIAQRLLLIAAAPLVPAFAYVPYAPGAAPTPLRASPRWSENPETWRVRLAMPAFRAGGGAERDHAGRARNFESQGARALAYRLEALRRLSEDPTRAIAAFARRLASMRLAPQHLLHAPLPKRLEGAAAPQLLASHIQAYRALKALRDRLIRRPDTS